MVLETYCLEQCHEPGFEQVSLRVTHVEIAAQNEAVSSIDTNVMKVMRSAGILTSTDKKTILEPGDGLYIISKNDVAGTRRQVC